MYRDIGVYAALHIVTHNILLVAVRSRDFHIENGYQLAVDVSLRIVGPSELADRKQQSRRGCAARNSINLSVRSNEASYMYIPIYIARYTICIMLILRNTLECKI